MDEKTEIRKAIEQLKGRGRGNPYPRELKDRITAYAVAQRQAGAELVDLGAELDVPWRTLARWSATPRTSRFRRVRVVATPTTPTVHGPHGIRIEGLSLDGLAGLLRRLG